MNAFNTDVSLYDPTKKVDYSVFYTQANVAKAQKWNLKSECDSYHLLTNNGLYKKGMTFNETFESIFACYKEAYMSD